ncbi:DUF1629 domain-containing protein [Bradyrhizobium sp. CCGUVB1N3]|uniref:imm11 family protein n=1 Tax=Bradyrhizobium sp. CCGUVB1N3 TaxID=2949629 RepID=UPI0020B2F1FD|nr:DUF1629 domain-containing protein [Bradyrhizobium sp. CCGUVB1N3]MCP3476989.1 DUF1629 domain-containing protein [Bradyrhizobium sp. CCGUVB1N3]
MTSKTVKGTAKRAEARKRKFYEMGHNYRRPGAPGFYLDERSVIPVGLERLADLIEPPCFVFDKSVGSRPGDLEQYYEFWLISDRTKVVFESIDPKGFSFVRCPVRVPRGVWDGPGYWLCEVLRVLDALDESRSRLKIGIRDDPRYRDFGRKFYEFFGGAKLVFKEELVDDVHAFRMAHNESCIICDQEMKDACKLAGLKGILFDDVSNLP